MFQKFKNLLIASVAVNETGHDKPSGIADKVQIAAAALMVEMANADGDFSSDEREYISKSLQSVFNMDKKSVNDIINISEDEVKESISLFEFSEVINKNFSKEEKINLIDHLWRLIYTDEKLDKYEDKLIKEIGGMLVLDRRDIIDSKLFIKQELEDKKN